jgi:YD repeat-containing protein
MRLAITHETRYDFDREVGFGEWRLMMRPADSHALRVVSAELQFSPSGSTRWAYDAFGNSVCFLTPAARSRSLSVTSKLVVDRYPSPLDAALDDSRSALPILYDTSDLAALAPLIQPETEDRDNILREWIRAEVQDSGSALEMLNKLNRSIHEQLTYRLRPEAGVQTPQDTLQLKSGACRDYAWLMMEVVRRLGFAARFASGYVAPHGGETIGGGATHAWCEVFLPSRGWIEFDPTNALAESPQLIRIASTRTPEEASPMRGSIFGDAASTLHVSVSVTPVAES